MCVGGSNGIWISSPKETGMDICRNAMKRHTKADLVSRSRHLEAAEVVSSGQASRGEKGGRKR